MVKHIIPILGVIVTLILVSSCNKLDVPHETIILGKGGMGIKSLYPMNSAASYYYASKHKIDGVKSIVKLLRMEN